MIQGQRRLGACQYCRERQPLFDTGVCSSCVVWLSVKIGDCQNCLRKGVPVGKDGTICRSCLRRASSGKIALKISGRAPSSARTREDERDHDAWAVEDDRDDRPSPAPCPYLPGTEGKILTLCKRFRSGHRLWHEDDERLPPPSAAVGRPFKFPFSRCDKPSHHCDAV
jgi:hypothetical protein